MFYMADINTEKVSDFNSVGYTILNETEAI